jgi:predicted N-acyltransferase
MNRPDMVRVGQYSSIMRVGESAWRALEPPDFPFFDFEFLLALERSRSVGRRTGWAPVYLVCEDGGRVLGAMPLYIKSDSYGEYVFDWAWANAYHQNGLSYYPKLVSAVPFTPATGPKLLVRPDADRATVTRALLEAARELGDEYRVSSSHALFVPESELDEFQAHGFVVRHSLQFHWRNRGYGSFADYLEAMTSKRRRQVARERRQLEGVEVEYLTGDQLGPEHAAMMYGYYVDTYDRKWGSPYLTAAFFDEVFLTMKDRVMLAVAREEVTRRPVAGALFFFKGTALFGRYWGATKAVRNLHFELCYYQGIEFAIERGLSLFEAGAQGEHKLARGFLPVVTYSAHEIRHPAFRRAIEHYIDEERAMISYELAEYMDHDPYR